MRLSTWSWALAVSASMVCVLAVGVQAARTGQSELHVEGQWNEVSKFWPIDEKDYFIATDKGHHYVQVQLPTGLAHDLEVSLEYYYSYSKTKPVMQMIPCLENIFLEPESTDNRNKWNMNSMVVRGDDCVKRNELAYNVILHDAGDVFAWRAIEIKQAPQQQQPPPTPAEQVAKQAGGQEGPEAGSAAEPPSQTVPAEQAADAQPAQVAPNEEPIKKSDSASGLAELFNENAIDSKSSSSSGRDSDRQVKKFPGPGSASFLREDDLVEVRPMHRLRRETGSLGRAQTRLHEATCRPSSCNRNQFRMSAFSELVRGLPDLSRADRERLSDESARFLVNLKNRPLRLTLRDKSVPIEDVDSCLDMQLYMEPNTEFELLLQDNSDPNRTPRPLETIRRAPGDSTASQWEQFNRCIGDYMPRFVPANAINNQNSLSLIVKPVGSQRPGQMAVLLDQKSGSFKVLHPVRSFLPGLQHIRDSNELNRYWILDHDGLEKPSFHFVPMGHLQISGIDPSQSSFDLTSRWMQIKDVETLEQPLMFIYRAERADWIDRIDFQYQRAGDWAGHWISQTVYQASTDKISPLSSPQAHSSSQASSSSQAASSSQVSEPPQTPAAEIVPIRDGAKQPPAKLIDVPITLKGADSGEFRVRVRHHLKKAAPGSAIGTSSSAPPLAGESLSLVIKSLAFADVCSYGREYCKNGAPCRPNGAAQAECVCETGFSGRFCERVRPCEVLYDVPDETSVMQGAIKRRISGQSLCRSMNAVCVEQLPVLRCEWENDQFYQCKKLYKLGADGDVYSIIDGQKIAPANGTGSSGTPGDGGSPRPAPDGSTSLDSLEPEQQVHLLKKENDEKSKLIIILSVFLIALLVFAGVLVGSMVSRLRVSASRLRSTRSELQEMSRNQLPKSARPAFNSRAQASAPRSYNNSAFDVEL